MSLLVYSHKITPRLTYIFRHIFTRILQIPVVFTTRVEDFIAHEGMKMSYTKYPLGNEFFVRSHELLFERGVSDVEFNLHDWKGVPTFFSTGEKSSLPYDIFAAGFYLLSRYEEYLPHVKDAFGRFPFRESLAYKHHFLEKPVLDIWVMNLSDALQSKFPNEVLTPIAFSSQIIVEVSEAFAYINKGVGRSLWEMGEDLYQLKFKNILWRLLAIFRVQKDPFLVYEWLLTQHQNKASRLILFFLMADYSLVNKSINIHNPAFRLLVKNLADHVEIGSEISLSGQNVTEKMELEIKRLEKITHRKSFGTFQSRARLNLPETYRKLIDLEVTEDYSMGYINQVGFRAGTSHPFNFYDLGYEIQTPLKIIPFCVSDEALKDFSAETRNLKLTQMIEEVRRNHGTFTAVFSHAAFSKKFSAINFRALYQKLLKTLEQ
ncbi:MAG: hypothetical protein KKC03_07015 [Bacteroidetes bacterium]|nr:hypothetical protein [Bacteroidota bacterium]